MEKLANCFNFFYQQIRNSSLLWKPYHIRSATQLEIKCGWKTINKRSLFLFPLSQIALNFKHKFTSSNLVFIFSQRPLHFLRCQLASKFSKMIFLLKVPKSVFLYLNMPSQHILYFPNWFPTESATVGYIHCGSRMNSIKWIL